MSVRWCFLGSHEILDDAERMVLARGGAQMCVPCAQTSRGQIARHDFDLVHEYRPNQTASSRFDRALRYWKQGGRRTR